MSQTIRTENVDGKNGVICLVSIFPSRVMVRKLSEKVHFFRFWKTSARNLSILKQFTYMHLKGLLVHFQKMLFFIIVRFTVSELLGFEVKELCLIFAEPASFLIF